jgi:site-specific DNA recombinase
MKIGIYCRVSTEEQKLKGVSLDDQRKRGIEFCMNNGHEYEIFDDGGYSGELSIQDRPALNSLFEKIYLEEIEGIYIVDFDRFSRDEKDGFVIKKTLIDNNVFFNDILEPFKLNFQILNLFCKSIPYDKEVWTDSDCLFVNYDSFEKIKSLL